MARRTEGIGKNRKQSRRSLFSELLEPRHLLASSVFSPESIGDQLLPGRGSSDPDTNVEDGALLPTDIAGSFLTSPSPSDSKSMFFDDVFQGSLDTCVFASVLSATSRSNFDLESAVQFVSETEGIRRYRVRMHYRDGSGNFTFAWRTVEMGNQLDETDLLNADDREFWPAVFQKAYLRHASILGRDYRDSVFAFESLTGRAANQINLNGSVTQARAIKAALDGGRPVIAGSEPGQGTFLESTYGLIGNHAYTILGLQMPASEDLSQTFVTLRNPWGEDTQWNFFDADQNGELTGQEYIDMQEGVDGNNDGVIRIPWHTFTTHFETYTISFLPVGSSINSAPIPELSPVFNTPNIGPFTIRQGESLGPITISATHPQGAALFYSLDRSPGYIQVQTGRFEWTPAADQSGQFVITVIAERNDFEKSTLSFIVNVESGAPRIGSLQATPTSIQDNGADLLTLTAKNVVHDFDTVDRVEFWRDADGSNTFSSETDVLLGYGTQNGADWSWSGHVGGLEVGSERFFARALRFSFSDYHYSATKSVDVTVTEAPFIPPVALPVGQQQELGGPNVDRYVLSVKDDGARGFRTLIKWRTYFSSLGTFVTTLVTEHYEPNGNMSTYGGDQIVEDFSDADIVTLPNGDYAVAYIKNSQIHVRWSNFDNSSTSTFTIAGETEAGGGLDIATDAQGNLFIGYHKGSYFSEDIWALTVARDGTVLRAPWRVNTNTDGMQKYPAVAIDAQGYGVIAWSDGSGGKVMSRPVFNAGVTEIDEKTVANVGLFDTQITATTGPNNEYYIAWPQSGIKLRRYAIFGIEMMSEPVTVSTFGGTVVTPKLEVSDTGILVAAWTSSGQDPDPNGEAGVYSQILTRSGQKIGPEFRVPNITQWDQGIAGIALRPDGSIMYGFDDGGFNSPNLDRPYYRLFQLDADPVFETQNIFGVQENRGEGTPVGSVKVVTGLAPTFELPASSQFTINPQTGLISVKAGAQLDHETQPLITLDVLVRSGNRSAVGTVTIHVLNVNEAPTISGTTPALVYRENASPVLFADGRVVEDLDSPILNGGYLSAQVTTNPKPGDRLTLIQGFGVSVNSSNRVIIDGASIGTVTRDGKGTNPLFIVFNSNATLPAVQRLLKSLAFSTLGENPSELVRTIRFRVNDGAGGVSISAQTKIHVVRVNDAPTLTGIGGTVGHTLNGPGVPLAATAQLTDIDSANFSGGKLHVRVTIGQSSSNRIFVGGTLFRVDSQYNVIRDGLVIGKLNQGGGIGTTWFSVTFNNQALPSYVQELIRALRFRTAASTSTATRVIAFSVSDGDGGVSAALAKSVTISS